MGLDGCLLGVKTRKLSCQVILLCGLMMEQRMREEVRKVQGL